MDATLLSARMFRIIAGMKQPLEKWKESARVFSEKEAASHFVGFNVAAIPGRELVFVDVEGPAKTTCANGWPTIAGLQQAHGALPFTAESATPSGGGLLIFRSGGKRIPFVDLSASHGLEMRTGEERYCLLPPSVFRSEKYSGEYVWKISPRDVIDSEGELPVIPDWLVDWFIQNQDSRYSSRNEVHEYTELEGVDLENYVATLADYLTECHSNIPEPDWFAVLGACHRAGERGLELFLNWSKDTGGDRWHGERTVREIRSKWDYLTRETPKRIAAGEPLAGLSAVVRVIVAQTPPQPMELKRAERIQAKPSSDPWPLLPLPGAAEDFRLALQRSMPWQDESLYTVPLLCAQAALQRKMVMWRDGLQSHWWAFVGGPASNKTTLKEIIYRVMEKTDGRMMLDSVESQNGLRVAFAEHPSRLLLMDEGLKVFNTVLSNEAKSKSDAALMSEILNRHNSKGDQQASTHKKKEDRIPFVKTPQLMVVTFDQEAYWNTFRSSQATTNGLLSRFFMLRMANVPSGYEERRTERLTNEEVARFSSSLRRIVGMYGPGPATGMTSDGKEIGPEFSIFGSERFARTVEADLVFSEFNRTMESWAQKEAGNLALLIRAVEGAKLLAQLCAAFDSKDRVMPEHARAACGIAARSVSNVATEADGEEQQIITAAAEVLRHHKRGLEMRELVQHLPMPLRRGKGSWTTAQRVIRSAFKTKGNLVSLS